MPYFLCQLRPPRASFLADMTAEERGLMLAHQQYMRPYVDNGMVIAMGPVADPKGGWGLGLVEALNLAEVESLIAKDPVILADRGFFFETHPMPQMILGRGAERASTFSVTP
jgi:uncharacterized protein